MVNYVIAMDRLSLNADERKVLGKKVKNLRLDGKLPGHVFGKGVEGENVVVTKTDFLKVFHQAGETRVIDLKIGSEKVRPVMIRDVQYDPVSNQPSHIDFYQVNLATKVKVPVPLELIGEQSESVKIGEAIVLQTINELEVEALPTDLIEKIEVDISTLLAIDDSITVGQLNFDRSKLTVSAAEDEIVVKLAPAVSAEMEKLLEEQAAETAAAAEEGAAEGEALIEGGTAEGEALKEVPIEGAEAKEDTARVPEEASKNE